MSSIPHGSDHRLASLKRDAQWAATTWHLVAIASYSRSPQYARKEASKFGWGKKARHSVEALATIYFQYDQNTFLKTVRGYAPTIYEDICLCECHHGIDGTFCDCCDTYGSSCFCHCHFCVHCDIEANKCSGGEECSCDCHAEDCCDDCEGCCWCQCHNCLECNSPDGECGDNCECECHSSCDDCEVRHAASESEDSCECECHDCSYCYNCASDCECECHDCCGDCEECECECHNCDYCDNCYDCSCECHDCCEDCEDDDSDDEDETAFYCPPANKVERVSERIEDALGVKLSIEETDQIDGARMQAAAYPDKKIKVTRDLANTMTDDELAFVIGHEYAHIEQKHIEKQVASREAKRAALRQGLSKMDTQMKEKGSGRLKRAAAHVVASALGEAGVAVTGRLESQHYETKADERALEVVEAAGYDPDASVTAYEKLHGGRVPEVGIIQAVTSTHPNPKSRHKHLKEKSKNRSDEE